MLIKNRFYFDLPLLERYAFIKDILRNFQPPSGSRSLSKREGLVARRER